MEQRIASPASEKCIQEDLLVDPLDARIIKEKLNAYLWHGRPHIEVRELMEWCRKYFWRRVRLIDLHHQRLTEWADSAVPHWLPALLLVPAPYLIGWIKAKTLTLFGLPADAGSLVGKHFSFVMFVVLMPRWVHLRWRCSDPWQTLGIYALKQ